MKPSAPQPGYPADRSVLPVHRYVWRPEPAPLQPRRAAGALEGRHVVVVGGTPEAANDVAATLMQHGMRVSRFLEGDPLPPFAGAPDGIVDLNVSAPFDAARPDAWVDPLRQTVAVLKAVYTSWLTVTDTSTIFYMAVTRLDGQMGYSGTAAQPLGGIWAGLAKTLPREIPNCNVKVLDLGPEEYARIGEHVARELYEWGLFEIGYSGGARFQLVPHREDAGEPVHTLGAGDTVLVSGGGRGIGFALARALAQNAGCRVVITGRSPAPSGGETWAGMSDEALKHYRSDRLKNIPAGSTVAAVRRELDHIGRQAELYRHLQQIAADGLRIEYRVCDFTDAEGVRALVDSLGSALTGVVHNAGVDTPVRLDRKSADEFVRTVSVKVGGFLAILDALNGRPLKFLCNVGSLTGRMGGMVGQLDYAAANDGLARLGLWAAGRTTAVVKTLCWPTWEKLGMIANYDATLKYMSALNVDEGLRHWQQELVTGPSAEASYMGHFGKALSPLQLNGFPMIVDLPQSRDLYSHWWFLGAAESFHPFESMRSKNSVDLRQAPCVAEFSSAGRSAVPISVILEFAISVGEWVVPDGYPDLCLEEIRDVRIAVAGLHTGGATYDLEKAGVGRWDGRKWIVSVTLTVQRPDGRVPIAQMRLVYGAGLGPLQAAIPAQLAAQPAWDTSGVGGVSWPGTLLGSARWCATVDGGSLGRLKRSDAADFWLMPFCPVHALPSAHIENIIRCGLLAGGSPARIDEITIAAVACYSGAGEGSTIWRAAEDESWLVLDDSGGAVVRVHGVSARGGAADGSGPRRGSVFSHDTQRTNAYASH